MNRIQVRRNPPASVLLSGSVLLVVMVMVGCVSAPPSASPGGRESKEQAQIQYRLEEIFDAAAKKDMPRLDSYHLYGPSFTKFSASQLGRQNATEAAQGEHNGLGAISALSIRADDLKIDVFGDVGIATFILNYSFKTANDTLQNKERSTLVFVKDGGTWKITHEHFSPFPGRAQ